MSLIKIKKTSHINQNNSKMGSFSYGSIELHMLLKYYHAGFLSYPATYSSDFGNKITSLVVTITCRKLGSAHALYSNKSINKLVHSLNGLLI